MPPVYSGHTLNPQQIELVKQWIDQGAKWQTHWAFEAPKRPELPNPPGSAGFPEKEQAWARNPIDRFILAKLEQEGLAHSPEAAKATLLRRVTYDLTGLPPTIAELDSFLADKSPDAYEKRVDALLASPRYGERMAVDWLDLARYADTHGYHIDSRREMWHWRDWVIDAFNRNLPYNQFTIDQLAGDLLPNATTEQKLASGFNRNHMINFEGGAIPEEYQVEYVVDRLEATSATWMGLTMGCARCHDHKYDPIPQRDFYRFFAFFNNVSEKGLDGRAGNAEPLLPLPSAEQQARQEHLKAEIAAEEKALPEETVAKQQSDWEKSARETSRSLVSDGLLAHYEFDGSLADSSGHYRYGRLTHGDLTYSNGAVDRGADFDGETRAVFGNFPSFENPKPFAAAFWLKVNGKSKDPVFRQEGAIDVWLDDFDLSGVQQRVPRLYVHIGGVADQNHEPPSVAGQHEPHRTQLRWGREAGHHRKWPGPKNRTHFDPGGCAKAGQRFRNRWLQRQARRSSHLRPRTEHAGHRLSANARTAAGDSQYSAGQAIQRAKGMDSRLLFNPRSAAAGPGCLAPTQHPARTT